MLTLKHCIKGSPPPPAAQTNSREQVENRIRNIVKISGLSLSSCAHLHLSPVAVQSASPVSWGSRKQASRVQGVYTVSQCLLSGAKRAQLNMFAQRCLAEIDWKNIHIYKKLFYIYKITLYVELINVYIIYIYVEQGSQNGLKGLTKKALWSWGRGRDPPPLIS